MKIKRKDTVTAEGRIYGAKVLEVRKDRVKVTYRCARAGVVTRWVALEDVAK